MPMTDVDSAESGQSPSRYAHAAAYAAVWGFGFLVLRIFAVSGYNWDTAFAVSTTLRLNDGVSLVFGSLMGGHLLAAMLLTWVLPLLVAASLWGRRGSRPVLMLLAALGLVMLVALTISFHAWWLPPASAAVLGTFALSHRLPPQHRLRRSASAALTSVGWVSGIAVLVVAALVPTPWVPQEQIRTTEGTITGYVLSVDSGYLNVLTDQHKFVILISSDVLSRR